MFVDTTAHHRLHSGINLLTDECQNVFISVTMFFLEIHEIGSGKYTGHTKISHWSHLKPSSYPLILLFRAPSEAEKWPFSDTQL